MPLVPIIASYSATSSKAIREFLTVDAIAAVERAIISPVDLSLVDPAILHGLVEMHVLSKSDRGYLLATSIFLQSDILTVNSLSSDYAASLYDKVLSILRELNIESPQTFLFVVGILGLGQTLGRVLRESGIALDWRAYQGRFAASKVDFREDCPNQYQLGPDILNKSVVHGERFTAVFLGDTPVTLNESQPDPFAMLFTGEASSQSLWSEAESLFLADHGVALAPVLTKSSAARFEPVVHQLGKIAADHYQIWQSTLHDFLANSTSGKQGVPIANMLMSLFRYLRRGISSVLIRESLVPSVRELSRSCIVFYENDIDWIADLFS